MKTTDWNKVLSALFIKKSDNNAAEHMNVSAL